MPGHGHLEGVAVQLRVQSLGTKTTGENLGEKEGKKQMEKKEGMKQRHIEGQGTEDNSTGLPGSFCPL